MHFFYFVLSFFLFCSVTWLTPLTHYPDLGNGVVDNAKSKYIYINNADISHEIYSM